MKLTLETLKQAGAFTGAPVEREIEWSQGGEIQKATTYVRTLSFMEAVDSLTSVDDKEDRLARRIAMYIGDEHGNPVFTADDITGKADPERGPLDGNLTIALLGVIGEVLGLGKKKS